MGNAKPGRFEIGAKAATLQPQADDLEVYSRPSPAQYFRSLSIASSKPLIIPVLFVGFLLLVCLQTFFKFLPDPVPHGVLQTKTLQAPALGSWLNGKFQDSFDAWVNEKIGFRSIWVRTENQLNFSLFHQVKTIPGAAGTQVVVGKDDWLYERWYVRAYLNSGWAKERDAEESARLLKQVQDLLERKHIPFLFVISPSKAEIYPEYIPDKYMRYSHRNGTTSDRAKQIEALQEYGVNYVDGHRILSEAKRKTAYILFPQGGTHWDYLGAALTLQEMLGRLNLESPTEIAIPAIGRIALKKPKNRDVDLSNLINIWTSWETNSPVPSFSFEAPIPVPKLNLLIIGDSFNFTLIELMRKANIMGRIDFLAWYNRHMVFPRASNDPFDPAGANWDQLVAGKDAVIYSINEMHLPDLKWAFAQDLSRYYEKMGDSSISRGAAEGRDRRIMAESTEGKKSQ